jgi:2-oxoglutarate ferredoxin oxidoreductase subunit alpha
MAKVLMKGNEAIAVAALKGGCEAFFGYPITPQNEIPEYLSRVMKEAGKIFVQAESEVASINMVYGAAGAGIRAMTSSSSPGIALMQEGISYLAGAELPCVIINVMRGGPGLGGIQPSQADYYQITRGGGNGDYRVIAFAPETLQETMQIVAEAFEIADYYRNPVMVAVDGLIGQMMESVDPDFTVQKRELKPKDWATTGEAGGRRIINSLYLDPGDLERHNCKLRDKYQEAYENEQRYELVDAEEAEVLIVVYGTMARICRSALEILRAEGIRVGMIRPISIWPFPERAFSDLPASVKGILCAELSSGQMIDDVKIAVSGRLPVGFFGRTGGMIPEPEEIVAAVKGFLAEVRHG